MKPLLLMTLASVAIAGEFSFSEGQNFLKTQCGSCHQGKRPLAGFNIARLAEPDSIAADQQLWTRVLNRVRANEMPPKTAPAPASETRQQFVVWLDQVLRANACAGGPKPGPAPIRRLNRNEYAATIRDLLNIHVNAGHAFPADGAGGEGFDNAAETLFLSPIHAEKYLEAAKQALDYGVMDPKARAVFLVAAPNADLSAEQAARKNLQTFLPRAFRHPVADSEVDRFLALFRAARKRGEAFTGAMLFALRGVLVSPNFLFRIEEPNPGPEPRLLADYALATRLSYFLWGSMPDQALFDLAAKGALHEPETLNQQIDRMLKDQKTREFAERFIEQWLNTRELGRDIQPDRTLFPMYYDAELQSAIKYEPVLFFQEILAQNLSLLNLLDSKFTILTNKLQKHYGLQGAKLGQQPVRYELPEGSHRGGVLSMAAVLAVSSLPTRTSPVLRGKWILDAMLGTPPPPPPPNVPALPEQHAGAAPQTMRERLIEHRQNPACATCHNSIDPLGFALENYDVLGRWRTDEAGKPIDSKGELPDGTTFDGVDQLKTVLLQRKDLFLRNLTSKMLGYALGRGLTIEDSCTVDQIVGRLKSDAYSSHSLIREIVLSVPFRYQQPAVVDNSSKVQKSSR